MTKVQDLLTNGIVIKLNGNHGTGKSVALGLIKKTLVEAGWSIDIDDSTINHEILVRMPKGSFS